MQILEHVQMELQKELCVQKTKIAETQKIVDDLTEAPIESKVSITTIVEALAHLVELRKEVEQTEEMISELQFIRDEQLVSS